MEKKKSILESFSDLTFFFYIKSKLKTKLETLFSKETSDVFGKWKSKHKSFFCDVLENSSDCSNWSFPTDRYQNCLF